MHSFGDMQRVEGWNKIQQKCQDVKFRKSKFCLFNITCTDPVVLRHISNGGIDTSVNIRECPSKENLRKTWDVFISLLDPKEAYMAVYDFGYYCTTGNYRNMIVLISLVPECVDMRLKIAYSSNIHSIKEKMSIPANYHFDFVDDLNYESIEESVSRVQIL